MSSAAHFILYVADQTRSAAFYKAVLATEPRLNVPGMSEFRLPGGAILGIMPESDIRKLLGQGLPDPSKGRGIPRSELYLLVGDPNAYHQRALACGATELSPLRYRDWGHSVAYVLDPDCHVLAFATAQRAGRNVA
ncbi:MAG: glyoxalase [Burkholderiales bacterium]|nr:glyoxalase [Burkholderiales bacterium]